MQVKGLSRGMFEIEGGPARYSIGDVRKRFRKSPTMCHVCVIGSSLLRNGVQLPINCVICLKMFETKLVVDVFETG